jgi:hypothetical protein
MRNQGLNRRVLAAFTFMALATIQFAAAGPATLLPAVVKIPCDTVPWMACKDLTTVLMDGQATAPNTKVEGGLKALIRQMLDDAYTGNVRLTKNVVNQVDCLTFDTLNQAPICSPLRIPENGCVDETVTAYKMPPGTTISPKCPAISKVGSASDSVPLYGLGKSDLGSMESSNIASGLVMAISNQGIAVQSEVESNALRIDPSSPCYSKAVSLNSLIAAQSSVQIIERINACNPAESIKGNECSAKQYFAATLKTILSAYIQLAQCRIADESQKKFVTFTMDPGSPKMKMYTDVLHDLYVQQCFYPNRGHPQALKDCYAQKYSAWINARARAAFPALAAACSGGSRTPSSNSNNYGNGSNGSPVGTYPGATGNSSGSNGNLPNLNGAGVGADSPGNASGLNPQVQYPGRPVR